MNPSEQELLEQELKRLRPAAIPSSLAERLSMVKSLASEPDQRLVRQADWSLAALWRVWLPIGIAATILVVAIGWRWSVSPSRMASRKVGPSTLSTVHPGVQIDRELLAVYDAVARLPSGEQVRFRCREWREGVLVRDAASKVEIEQSTPQLEIVPVRFETY